MEKCYWQQTALSVLLGISLAGIAQASDLTDLLRQTLDNPGISARELQSQAASEDATAANMRYFGQASVFAGQTRYESPRIVGVFAPGVTPLPVPVSNDITQYGVNYHLPVDVFGSIAAERQQAQAGKETAQLLERQETLLRLHQTLGAYVRLQALAAQSQALQAEQKQLEVYADRVREEVKLGRTAKIDLSLVQSDLARLAAQQAIFVGNQRAALAALKASANAAEPAISANIGVPALQNTDAQASLPVLLAKEQESAADAANQKAHRNLYPAFSVDSQYANFNGGGLATQPHNIWSVGINMNIPIDPVGMKSASAASQRAQVAQQQAQAAQADTIAQLATLEANYQSALGNASALAAEVEHRQEVVTIQREKWRLGASTMDELLYQERNLLDVQYAYADARAQAATAWSGMQVLLGTPSAEYIHSLEITP
ncbi:outer membrane efflux protein [mine drainage metagenome]|uniref:Outer membrane efflux protein n=1 Tax=mine drainage metagenome TaxID=410659 RepID=A0A1J5SH61_9ZZZZ